jgi:hypothetical protein
MLLPRERQRQEVHDQKPYRPEKEPDRLPRPLERLLRRSKHLALLCKRLVSTPGLTSSLKNSSPPYAKTLPRAAKYSGSQILIPAVQTEILTSEG